MALREQDGALYAMADMGAGPWRANAGVRVVETREHAFQNVLGGPNPIGLTNINGPYTPTEIDHTYYDVLPSVNLRYELTKDLIGRLAAARTLARPDYSALAGAVQNLDYTFLTGSGGNPNLKPIRSNNFETSLEWYFQPRSMISVGAFYLDMPSYVDYGVSTATYFNTQYRMFTPFQISAPINVPAHDGGFEVSYQQALPLGFGFVGNYTYADGSTRSGTELVGASRTTYNLQGYYENRRFSARLAYTYRSAYLVGLNSSFAQHEDAVGSLDASLSYKLSDNFSVMFDALNLTDAVLKYYGVNRSQPEAFYTNGRQYYAGVRVSL
jgi:iron complex outermembrane receptor protein